VLSVFSVPNVPLLNTYSDYRPNSITPVLTGMWNRPTVVKHFLYPFLQTQLTTLTFTDQFAFRPSGSTTAVLLYILHTVTQLLSTSSYVVVNDLDFSKAFDTVRHKTLLRKLTQLNMPDRVYDWMVDFYTVVNLMSSPRHFWPSHQLVSFRVQQSSSSMLPTRLQLNQAIYWLNMPTIRIS